MRGGRDEERVSPMFPRLHINDTEKGGPRAPPRNKMALYEQLTIPCQRFTSGTSSILPLPPSNYSDLAPSASPNLVAACQNMLNSFCYTPLPSNIPEKLHSHDSYGNKLNNMRTDIEHKFTENTSCKNVTSSLSLTAKCDSFERESFSNLKNYDFENLGNENDSRESASAQGISSPHHISIHQNEEREKLPQLSLSSTVQCKSPCDQQRKRAGIMDLKSRHFVKNHAKCNSKVSQIFQNFGETSSSILVAREKTSKMLKQEHTSLIQGNKSSSIVNSNKLHGNNANSFKEFVAMNDEMTLRDDILAEPKTGTTREVSSESRLVRHDSRSPNGLEYGCEWQGKEDYGTLRAGIEDRRESGLETSASMVDTVSVWDASPDDVVRVIGEKQFWKARKYIINQQRVFALQVFELHRLIKVQRLIASSPHIFIEDNLPVHKPVLETSSVKMPSKYVSEPGPPPIKPKHNPHKRNPDSEFTDDNIVRKLPLPSVNATTSKDLFSEQSNHVKNSSHLSPASLSNNSKAAPLSFHALPGNQWLVPVISPSEGLVYKPYTGPCPPPASFLAPAYGGYGPINLNSGSGDFLNASYGAPATNQQGMGVLPATPPIGQTYFPPYSMPIIHPSLSRSATEKLNPFGRCHSTEAENTPSCKEMNFTIPQQRSCNMSRQFSQVVSRHTGKFQAPRGSELQGSRTSSPSERTKGNALPLFPMVPTVQETDRNKQTTDRQSTVIKVVPHNPRLATESAARIFQSIQAERKQL